MVIICGVIGLVVLLHHARSVPPAHAARTTPNRGGSEREGTRQGRLGALSSKVVPAIARPEVGDEVMARELAGPFEAYRAVLCDRVDANARSIGDPDAVLGLSVSHAGPARHELLARFSVGEVPRRAAPDVADWIAEMRTREQEPCAVLAVLQLLSSWPEAEPGSLLAEIATHPPNGSDYLANFAIGAMGGTGRADYEDVLASFVDPARDPRTITRALRASALISGDAWLASKVVDDSFPFDERLARGLPGSMVPAEGLAVGRVMQRLLVSRDPLRKEAGLRAAALGVGMPEALPRVIEAAADPALSSDAARHAMAAIAAALPADAETAFIDLAARPEASPDARAAALARVKEPPLAMAVEVARRGPDPLLAVDLALRAERASPGAGQAVLEALATSDVPADLVVQAIVSADDEALARVGRAAYPDPRLW